MAISHFEVYLYGQTFDVYTDHKPCLALQTGSHLNKRLRRLALKLQGWNVSIKYRPGIENRNADGLSWRNWENDDADVCQILPEGMILGGGGGGGGDVGKETEVKGKKKKTDEDKEKKRRR